MSYYSAGLAIAPRTGGYRRALVAGSFLQSPGDIDRELEDINSNILSFDRAFFAAVTGSPGYPHPEPRPLLEELYGSAWGPLVRDWQAFYAKWHDTWKEWWWNPTGDAEALLQRYKDIRAKAEALGLDTSAVPVPPEPPRGAVDSLSDSIWKVAKALLWIALGVFAVGLAVRGF